MGLEHADRTISKLTTVPDFSFERGLLKDYKVKLPLYRLLPLRDYLSAPDFLETFRTSR